MSRLFTKTRELLRATTIPIERIVLDTGVRYNTVQRIKSLKNESMPAVDTCEKLYTYLSGKQLEL